MDPAVILDFDPSRPEAQHNLDLLVEQVNAVYPLVLYGRLRDPWNREVKKMLGQYKITPAPLIVDVDRRRDHEIFIPLLARLLGSDELPQLVLRGKSLGSYHDLLDMRDSGDLSGLLENGGLVVRDRKHKKGTKEQERHEVRFIDSPLNEADRRWSKFSALTQFVTPRDNITPFTTFDGTALSLMLHLPTLYRYASSSDKSLTRPAKPRPANGMNKRQRESRGSLSDEADVVEVILRLLRN